ncbi:UNVERIFIED_ORG: phage gpG-like protein [Comamonas terrigena]
MLYTVELQVQDYRLALDTICADIATPAELLGSIGESLHRVNSERHDQGQNPDGTPWAPTRAKKRRMLWQNGDLLGSFSYQVRGDELKLGFSDQKAPWHHYGTGPYVITAVKARALSFNGMFRKRVRHPGLPARRLVGFPDADKQLVADVVDDHLKLILNRVR